MRTYEIVMVLVMLALVSVSFAKANDDRTPDWVVEPVPERLTDLLAQGIMYDTEGRGLFLPSEERPRRWKFLSPEGEQLASFKEPDRARWIVDDRRRLLGFATSNMIFPVIEGGNLGEPFETIDGFNVRGHRTQNRTLFVRWGYADPVRSFDMRPRLPGFTVYDQDGRIVLEKGEYSGFFFQQLLDEAVVVADDPDERERRFKLIGFDGEVKATFGEPHDRRDVRSTLFRQQGGEYAGVETRRKIDSEWKRTIEVYRQDGRKVAHIENAEGIMWRFHGHYLVGQSWDDDGWKRSFYVCDLQTGGRVAFTYDLQTGRREGDEVVPVADSRTINQDTLRPNTFGGGERLMVIRVRGSEKGDSFLRACVLDVKTSEIVWTGEPQKYQKEGENVEGYDIIERYIGEPVPGETDALFMFTEKYGPSIIRRVAP